MSAVVLTYRSFTHKVTATERNPWLKSEEFGANFRLRKTGGSVKSDSLLILIWCLVLATASFAQKSNLVADSETNSGSVAGSTANKFDHAEYMKATSAGQKRAEPAVKGTLLFDGEQKAVDFLDSKRASAFSIKYDSIKTMLYEEADKPRYAEAVLISPLFLLSHSKKHYLTIQYTDGSGAGQFVIVHLDKKNARDAVAAAEAATGKKVERVEAK